MNAQFDDNDDDDGLGSLEPKERNLAKSHLTNMAIIGILSLLIHLIVFLTKYDSFIPELHNPEADNWVETIALIGYYAHPFLVFVSILLSILLFQKKKYELASKISFLPGLTLVLTIICLFVGFN